MNNSMFCIPLIFMLVSCQAGDTIKQSQYHSSDEKKTTSTSVYTKNETKIERALNQPVKAVKVSIENSNIVYDKLITPLPFDSDLYVKCANQPNVKECKSKINFVEEENIPEYAKSFSSSAERLILPNLNDGTQVFVSANAEGDDADVGSTVFIELINPQKKMKEITIEVGQSIKIDKNYQAKIYEHQKGKVRLIKQGYILDLAEDLNE